VITSFEEALMLPRSAVPVAFLAFFLVCFAALPADAQSVSVSGSIVDATSAVVPGATVVLNGPAGRDTTFTGPRGEYRFVNVAAGSYTITVSLVGFAQQAINVVVGSADLRVPAIQLSVATIGETVVVSAARIETALVDAPATMSVLTSEVLASTPAQNYGDLLRGVPGLNVVQLSARDVNLTSRQATSTLTNSQLVLLDGRSIYLDFFGLVLWDFLPTNLADINQIEVIRGPASAVWGANALTGVVNILTKSPRDAQGATVSLSGGGFSRNAGAGVDRGMGSLFGANVTFADAPNDRWSYRLSTGYFDSEPFARPAGRIPLIQDPRDARLTVGGAPYPADGTGPVGTAFSNRGTSQPKFTARIDQDNADGSRLTYEGGVGGTQGIIYSGLGPFDIQSGSYMGFARVNYVKSAFRLNFFSNFVDAEAPNLLLIDPTTAGPLQLNFSTQTYDLDASNAWLLDSRQVLSVGGNIRRNNFELTIAPASENRTELGAYVQDDIQLDRVRLTLGARVDKFGNLEDPVFSPRVSATFKVTPDHALRASFNRAFRSPSVINNYLQTSIVVPTDLSGLAPLLPAVLRPLVAAPFPLVVQAVGSNLPIGANAQGELKEESLTAYEVAYTGNIAGRTTVGVAFYVNDIDDQVNFSQLPSSLDPYTAANPPPGWQLPAALLPQLAALGIFLPRTAFTYLNLGPLRQKGLELSLDHRVARQLTAFANYSWQDEPDILDDPNPYPAIELALPPTNRFNVGFNYDGPRFLGSGSINYSDKAFWSDVLNSPFHGFTDAYTLVNGSFGMKWQQGRVTTLVKVNNIFNKDVQQHVFGDILKLSAVAEVRFNLAGFR
jgi:outer membrane receptor protein involved in Fe transport